MVRATLPRRISFTGLPGDRLPTLRKLLDVHKNRRVIRILETHSALSGLIAEHATGKQNHATFDGMWSSSLTASAVCGMPDIEAVDTSSRLNLVRQTMAVTTKPMIYDGDTGGLPEIFKFTVRSLEQIGVSAIIIEDKEGLKQNSLLENSNDVQHLIPLDAFCDKIRAGRQASRSDDFMIFARMESLIAGRSVEEALERAAASVDAGASGVMIHSRKKTPDEVLEFMSRFRTTPEGANTPIVVVPTSYNTITEDELHQGGASICIYANQMLRASYPAMMNVAESLLTNSRAYEADSSLMKIKEIVSLIDMNGEMGEDATKRKVDVALVALGASAKPPAEPQRRNMNGLRNYSAAAAEDVDKPEKTTQVDPSRFLSYITSDLGIRFFTGVPDSCIATFCSEVEQFCDDQESSATHVITANEGSSVALAIGNHLATGDVPLVYMQNSGIGNAVNPLLSAAHPEVYSIPMVLFIGWRGCPGMKDEPQHMVTGRQCRELLQSMEIGTYILPKDEDKAKDTMREAVNAAKAGDRPVAVLVEPATFTGKVTRHPQPTDELSREAAMSQILDIIGPDDAVVATTGFTSRELYELRESRGRSHQSDFLCVGSMGHALGIAQGIALAQPNRTVWCLDGDGAALMHLGSFSHSAPFNLTNLRHILFNNEAHESVGEQKTAASQGVRHNFSFTDVASSMGYASLSSVSSSRELNSELQKFDGHSSPTFLEVKVNLGSRSDLGRPKHTTRDAKNAFIDFLS